MSLQKDKAVLRQDRIRKLKQFDHPLTVYQTKIEATSGKRTKTSAGISLAQNQKSESLNQDSHKTQSQHDHQTILQKAQSPSIDQSEKTRTDTWASSNFERQKLTDERTKTMQTSLQQRSQCQHMSKSQLQQCFTKSFKLQQQKSNQLLDQIRMILGERQKKQAQDQQIQLREQRAKHEQTNKQLQRQIRSHEQTKRQLQRQIRSHEQTKRQLQRQRELNRKKEIDIKQLKAANDQLVKNLGVSQTRYLGLKVTQQEKGKENLNLRDTITNVLEANQQQQQQARKLIASYQQFIIEIEKVTKKNQPKKDRLNSIFNNNKQKGKEKSKSIDNSFQEYIEGVAAQNKTKFQFIRNEVLKPVEHILQMGEQLGRVQEILNGSQSWWSGVKTNQYERAKHQLTKLIQQKPNMGHLTIGLYTSMIRTKDMIERYLKLIEQNQSKQKKTTTQFENEIGGLKWAISQLQREIQDKKGQISLKDKNIQTLTQNCKKLQGQKESLKFALSIKNNQLQIKTDKAQKCKLAMGKLKQKLEILDKQSTQSNVVYRQRINKMKSQVMAGTEELLKKATSIIVQQQQRLNEINKKAKQFQDKVNELNKEVNVFKTQTPKFIKDNLMEYNLDLDPTNLDRNLTKFSELYAKVRILKQSDIYKKLEAHAKQQLIDSIKLLNPNVVKSSSQLWSSFDNTRPTWLSNISDKPNLLVLIRPCPGHQLAIFSENPWCSIQQYEGNVLIVSLRCGNRFKLKAGSEGKGLCYNQYLFMVGNEEIVIKEDYTFNLFTKKRNSCFDFQKLDVKEMLGQEPNPNDNYKYEAIEFHQLFYD